MSQDRNAQGTRSQSTESLVVAVFDEAGTVAVGGPETTENGTSTPRFTAIPSGSFTYEGLNILRYSGRENRGQIQDGEFELTVNFTEETGTLTGNTTGTTQGTSADGEYLWRSTMRGDIILDNETGDFRSPDNGNLVITLTENGAPRSGGAVNTKINGNFTTTTSGVHGVSGIYQHDIIHGAIIGYQCPTSGCPQE